MIKLIKSKMEKWKKQKEAKIKLKNAQRYYKILKAGSLFLEFIRKDMDAMKQQKLNRHQRRRFEKQISEKGQFSEEIIVHYTKKVDEVLKYIENKLQEDKNKSQKVDGQSFFNKCKKLNKK